MAILQVHLFSDLGNNAILQIPGRKSPGVLIQKDSFENLLEMAKTIRNLAAARSDELKDEVEGLCDYLQEIFASFDLANGER